MKRIEIRYILSIERIAFYEVIEYNHKEFILKPTIFEIEEFLNECDENSAYKDYETLIKIEEVYRVVG